MREANCNNLKISLFICSVEDVDHLVDAHATVSVVPTAEQLCWDGRDAQAHALIAFSVKRATPHIRSCKIAKDAWDTLTTLYQARNEARVAYLRKQLESEHMNKGDSIDNFLTKIKDLKEQLIFC